MPLFNSILSWLMKKRIHQIELFLKYPQEVQHEWLRKLIVSAKDTEWGQRYEYSSIQNWETFKERVPIQTYDSLRPDIMRICNGEQNILWHSDIKWFAKSSGTTSDKSKFIPVSQEAMEECHYKGGKDLLSIYCNNYPDTQLFTGKSLALGGSEHLHSFSSDAFYGDLSAVLIQNLPFWAEFLRTPNLTIALLDEWETKLEEMAKATLNQNVTNIAGVPSWLLILLERILEISGKSNMLEVWPNVEMYMHGGVNFSPYRSQFEKLFPGRQLNYIETYNASEGFFGIKDTINGDDMLLMLDYGIFYEFIPISELDKDFPKAHTIDSVEIGVNYAIVITTNAGLWRYLIGDTVVFTSLNPHRIRITGRTKSYINAFGEELIVDNAEKALKIACEKTGAIIREYTAAPVYFGEKFKGAHEWLFEFEKHPSNIEYFTEIMDNALKALNSDYEAKRYHNMALDMPIVRVMKENTFYNWLKNKGKLGGQHKVPRLNNDRILLEEIINISNQN